MKDFKNLKTWEQLKEANTHKKKEIELIDLDGEEGIKESLFDYDLDKDLISFFSPKEDFNLSEFEEDGYFLWETERGDVFCSMERSENLCTITCRLEPDYLGKHKTTDFDSDATINSLNKALTELKTGVMG